MTWLHELCSAIATMEGYFTKGSIARELNNPGNLRPWWSDGQTSEIAKKRGIGDVRTTQSGRFVVGITAADGIGALYCDVMLKIAQGMTLRQLIHAWAPLGDGNNNPSIYLDFVSAYTGIDPDVVLKRLLMVKKVN